VSGQTHVPTGTLLDGLTGAVSRLRVVDPAAPEGFHALFEALAWAGALRDRLRQENRAIPRTLNGLYYVRNLVIHQGADVVLLIASAFGEGAFASAAFGGPMHVFPARAELPTGESKKGAPDYDTDVARNEVLSVFDAAADAVRVQL
jgi:hypothetical protein